MERERESFPFLSVAVSNAKLHAGSFHRKRSPSLPEGGQRKENARVFSFYRLRFLTQSFTQAPSTASGPPPSQREVKGRRTREFSLSIGCSIILKPHAGSLTRLRRELPPGGSLGMRSTIGVWALLFAFCDVIMPFWTVEDAGPYKENLHKDKNGARS